MMTPIATPCHSPCAFITKLIIVDRMWDELAGPPWVIP